MTTVSILITSFNQADVLPEALDSAVGQTHDDLEVIVVDAASEDESRSIIKQYAAANPEVVPVLLDDDPGIPAMRNRALEHASGDCFTFLDGDDKFCPRKVEKELAILEGNPDERAVFSNFRYVDEDGSPQGTWAESKPPTGDVLADMIARRWPRGTLFRSALIDMSVLKETGGYDEELTIYEDWEFKIRLAEATRIAYCPEVLSVYRRHERGVSSRVSADVHSESMRYILRKHRGLADSDNEDLSLAFDEARKTVRRQEAMAYVNDGNRTVAVFKYVRFLVLHPEAMIDYRYHLRVFLPKPMFSFLKWLQRGVRT